MYWSLPDKFVSTCHPYRGFRGFSIFIFYKHFTPTAFFPDGQMGSGNRETVECL